MFRLNYICGQTPREFCNNDFQLVSPLLFRCYKNVKWHQMLRFQTLSLRLSTCIRVILFRIIVGKLAVQLVVWSNMDQNTGWLHPIFQHVMFDFVHLKGFSQPWPDGTFGWSIIPWMLQMGVGSIPSQGRHLRCGFEPQLGYTQEAADQCFCLSLSLSLCPFLSP